ncbi:M48 family metalloprotease [Amycolatopsis tucumanensis]|uniref:Peptidase M48 domain-containing protein n=1 Tax=Amycolatopsis tucumanensis TaxID=401106 RepID=A0ABP7JX13_9PSEU|nr:M48 family metalloprotease [Amycolatopsis tucumanensis]MCF6427690.1 M48 family metalloprotease [Amycolatopsis tucumanensis]
MLVAFALLAGAVVAGWCGPALLRRWDPSRAPRTILAAWLLAVLGGALSAAVGVVVLLTPGHGVFLVKTAEDCWIALSRGTLPSVGQLTGLAGALLLVVVAARFVIHIVRDLRERDHTNDECLTTLRTIAQCDGGSPMTFWVDDDEPMAFSLARRPAGIVVATTGLAQALSAKETAAALEHEYAHLRGRHHLLVLLLDSLSKALPIVPLFRQAPSAARELVELAADDAAARACGAGAIRSAISALACHDLPYGSLTLADDAVSRRLARLDHTPAPARPGRRALWPGLATLTAVVLPAAAAIGVLTAVIATCQLAVA